LFFCFRWWFIFTGTTDYAVEIFHHAVEKNSYVCYLSPGRVLPMMYMPDCIKATLSFLAAKNEHLTLRTYNVHALSFAPEELAAEITKHRPGFTLHFRPDFRDEIARSWPQSLDDSSARKDWGWRPDFDLSTLVTGTSHFLTLPSLFTFTFIFLFSFSYSVVD
jgi:nucleoside-diphosphate-sugar epimerase